jgi:transposase
VGAQVRKLCERFGLERVVMVSDRGMLTSARIEQDLGPDGVDWISALRAPQIRKLADEGALQLSLFDKRDLAEIKSVDFPNERLVACRNPLLLEERRRKRNEMLAATEKKLELIRDAVDRSKRPLRGKDRIGMRVGLALARTKMGKHFKVEFTDDSFHFERRQTNIEREAALDGIYVIRTSLPKCEIDPESVVRAYKQLANVERAFRSIKTIDLKIRPVFHYTADRVRSHVFLCMLAYYVEWHMREALALNHPLIPERERWHRTAGSRRGADARGGSSHKLRADDQPTLAASSVGPSSRTSISPGSAATWCGS